MAYDSNQYAAQQSYEMSTLNGGGPYGGQDDMSVFFSEIDSIKNAISQFDNNVARIESLHNRSLNEIDTEQDQWNQKQIDALVAETSQISNTLKYKIKSLEGKSRSDSTKRVQVDAVKRTFMDSIQRFQSVEASYGMKYKERAKRQYRIVRPDATEDEVRQAIEDTSGSQIFSQALLNSNRRGEARTALTEVQNRHKELQKMERTLGELVQLFKDMEELVEVQAQDVQAVDHTVKRVENDVNKGVEETRIAVKHARAARRKKWICLGIILIICIILAIVLGVVFGRR
ncbi:t-SNARE [Lipomyces tetrasporus]|uniref:t-SNARE n=1 Tax=Lipomyces tetrasporus TaxID=54092 RepID=A0AAD7QUX4_9ASCO|nr:t-SNARE [Lipomyces tetrasporus]KAJ8101820.1 t-SNARE [Lipomyces tetrasporus]